MKSLQQQINESLILNIVLWIMIVILGFLSWRLVELCHKGIKYDDVNISDPNLFANIKLHGILWGFIDWYNSHEKYERKEFERKEFERKEFVEYEEFDKMVHQLAENADFQEWCKQPISKRKLRDLKAICESIFDKKQMKMGRHVAEHLFHRYTNKANEITDNKEYKEAEKEVQKLI